MTVVTELDLPEIDYNQPGFGPDTYHELLGAARQRSWLAHSPLAYIVLDGESGDFFLRARQTTFPGRQIAELFGITDGPLHENVENNILNLTGDKHRRLRSGSYFAGTVTGAPISVLRQHIEQQNRPG